MTALRASRWTFGFLFGALTFLSWSRPAGAEWSARTSGTGAALIDVRFLNELEGWAAGVGGVLLKTVDGGEHWSELDTGVDRKRAYNTVRFVDSSIGWASGLKVVRRTADGGQTWAEIVDPLDVQTPPYQNRLVATSASTAWVVGGERINVLFWRYTFDETDQMLHYTRYAIANYELLNGASFPDENNGWAVGSNGTIIRIGDAMGAEPTFVKQATGITAYLDSVFMLDVETGWAVGESGVVLKTINGGGQWLSQTTDVTAELWNLHFVDDQRGWAVGDGGLILHTDDGGASWAAQPSGTSQLLLSVHFPSPRVGFAVGAGGTILKWELDCSSDATVPKGVCDDAGHDIEAGSEPTDALIDPQDEPGEPADTNAPSTGTKGCGCRVGPSPLRGLWALAPGALGLAAARFRKRKRPTR